MTFCLLFSIINILQGKTMLPQRRMTRPLTIVTQKVVLLLQTILSPLEILLV